jgi:hypothetical protein
MARLFLDGAHVVLDAVADNAVGLAWDTASTLEGQAVSGLAGHLARGGVWVVGEYLDGAVPTGAPDFDSATDYYAVATGRLTAADHRAIRERGASIAAVGHGALVTVLAERLAALEPRLRSEPGDRLVAVIGGRTIRLDEYLVTRLVEQIVHLDDLARSVGRAQGWPVAPEAEALVIAVGADIGRRRVGGAAMTRALYRAGFAEGTLPVL